MEGKEQMSEDRLVKKVYMDEARKRDHRDDPERDGRTISHNNCLSMSMVAVLLISQS